MIEIWQIALLLGVGIIAGFINVLAGGGSSIVLPVLIFMGLEGAVANGTSRVAIMVQTSVTAFKFKQKTDHSFKQSFHYSLWTLPGAIIGAWLSVKITDQWFQRILVLILVAIVISMLLPQKPNQPISTWLNNGYLKILTLLAIGFYGGFIQVGVGLIIMAVMVHVFQLDLLKTNIHKAFIVAIYTLPSLAIFIYTDNVHWLLGLTLAIGNAIGGWLGVHSSLQGGEKLIKKVLAGTVLIMAIKLALF